MSSLSPEACKHRPNVLSHKRRCTMALWGALPTRLELRWVLDKRGLVCPSTLIPCEQGLRASEVSKSPPPSEQLQSWLWAGWAQCPRSRGSPPTHPNPLIRTRSVCLLA